MICLPKLHIMSWNMKIVPKYCQTGLSRFVFKPKVHKLHPSSLPYTSQGGKHNLPSGGSKANYFRRKQWMLNNECLTPMLTRHMQGNKLFAEADAGVRKIQDRIYYQIIPWLLPCPDIYYFLKRSWRFKMK